MTPNMITPRLTALAVLLLFTLASHAAELAPFTEPPRSVRSRDIDQQHIRLELDLDWETQTIDGRAVHTLVPLRDLETLELDAADMEIERVRLLATPFEGSGRATPSPIKKPAEGAPDGVPAAGS